MLDKIYKAIDALMFRGNVFMLYEINIGQTCLIPEGVTANVFRINIDGNIKSNIDELVVQLAECGRPVLLGDMKSDEESDKFKKSCRYFGVNYTQYEPLEFLGHVDLANLRYNDLEIIKELLGIPSNAVKFNRLMFMHKIEVKSDGSVFVCSNYRGSLKDEEFIAFLLDVPDQTINAVKDEFIVYTDKKPVSADLYEPWPFFDGDPHISKKIIGYKYRVFQAIKNIDEHQYMYIDRNLIDLLNEHGYIQLKDIEAILKEVSDNAYNAV
jgi:hypothetical protein